MRPPARPSLPQPWCASPLVLDEVTEPVGAVAAGERPRPGLEERSDLLVDVHRRADDCYQLPAISYQSLSTSTRGGGPDRRKRVE